jgi:hypothetical protein
MADTFRCINAFNFGDRMYPGGFQVEEGDPILQTHGDHFARVESPVVVEATTAAPGERRDLTPPRKAPAKKAAPKKATTTETPEENGTPDA